MAMSNTPERAKSLVTRCNQGCTFFGQCATCKAKDQEARRG
jgi:hypothetical protein